MQSTPKNNVTSVPAHVAVLRLMPCSSDKKVTITSSNEIVDVSAAIANKMKNIMQKKYPPTILSKIIGNVLNASPAPASGCIPKLNAAGKMMIPANIATNVSATTTDNDVVARLSFLLM